MENEKKNDSWWSSSVRESTLHRGLFHVLEVFTEALDSLGMFLNWVVKRFPLMDLETNLHARVGESWT